jgi:hypothetical protein
VVLGHLTLRVRAPDICYRRGGIDPRVILAKRKNFLPLLGKNRLVLVEIYYSTSLEGSKNNFHSCFSSISSVEQHRKRNTFFVKFAPSLPTPSLMAVKFTDTLLDIIKSVSV